MKSKLKSWMIELRAPFLTATLAPVFLGTTIALARQGALNPTYFLLCLIGAVFSHLGTNVVNDYFDHKSGNDEINQEFVRPFSGGSRTIQLGLLTPREVFLGAVLFFASATIIGLYFTLTLGAFMLVLVAIGLISGFFYTGNPLNWASKGIGETLVAANFGALMTLGAFYVQAQRLAFEPLVASIPISLLIAAVLYINEFQDYTADKAVGKNTLVVRLGRQKAAYGYALIVSAAYLFVIFNVVLGVTPVYTLFALIPLPLALYAMRHTFRFHSEPFSLVPANALTVVFHFLTGVLLSLGYLGYIFELGSLAYFLVVATVAVCVLFTVNFYLKIKRAKPPV